jgi:hypothetical protein
MATRKKWRLQALTISSPIIIPATSRAEAYRKVEDYRHSYRALTGRIHTVKVQVDEGNGWTTHERIDFTRGQ